MKGLGGFLSTAFIVVILVGSVSRGAIDIGAVASIGIDFGMALVEASMDVMRASE